MSPNTRSHRLYGLILCGLLLVSLLTASPPTWWSTRGVVIPGKVADDFAAINQGQLKHLMKAASEEMALRLGTGNAPAAPAANTATADDFAVVTVGQLKAAAKPYYNALMQAGQIVSLPSWLGQSAGSDFAVANIGQAKMAFGFSIASGSNYSSWSSSNAENGATRGTVASATASVGGVAADDRDSDGDGFSDQTEIDGGTNPFDWDSDDDGISDGLESTSGSGAYRLLIFSPHLRL